MRGDGVVARNAPLTVAGVEAGAEAVPDINKHVSIMGGDTRCWGSWLLSFHE